MRFKSRIVFSLFSMLLMSFVFLTTEQNSHAQDLPSWCCNNNSPTPQDGFCVQAPNGAQNCNGASQTFFEDGVDGIILVPMGNGPQFPQSGDLCPNPAPLREACMCEDENGNVVECQTLIPPPPTNPPPTNPPPTNPPPTNPPPTNPPPTNPPPTNPPPTNPPPTNPPPTNPPPTNPPPTNPPPTNPPPTNPPPTNPPPTNPPPTNPPPTNPPPSGTPGEGCCVESKGVCSIETSAACSVPPNLEFLGVGSSCTNQPLCVPPPTNPPPTDVPPTEAPPTESPAMGCCVEALGACSLELASACSVPPNVEFTGIGTTCENVAACNVPPPVAQVPTMSEWGLIATAVMLGLFSLFTVRRGFKINTK